MLIKLEWISIRFTSLIIEKVITIIWNERYSKYLLRPGRSNQKLLKTSLLTIWLITNVQHIL